MAVLSHRLWGGVWGCCGPQKGRGGRGGCLAGWVARWRRKNIGVGGLLYLARLLRRLCACGPGSACGPFPRHPWPRARLTGARRPPPLGGAVQRRGDGRPAAAIPTRAPPTYGPSGVAFPRTAVLRPFGGCLPAHRPSLRCGRGAVWLPPSGRWPARRGLATPLRAYVG